MALRCRSLARPNSHATTRSTCRYSARSAWLEREQDWRADIVVQLRPTSPLRFPGEVDAAVRLLLGRGAPAVSDRHPGAGEPYKMWLLPEPGAGNFMRPLVGVPDCEEPYNMLRQMLPQVLADGDDRRRLGRRDPRRTHERRLPFADDPRPATGGGHRRAVGPCCRNGAHRANGLPQARSAVPRAPCVAGFRTLSVRPAAGACSTPGRLGRGAPYPQPAGTRSDEIAVHRSRALPFRTLISISRRSTISIARWPSGGPRWCSSRVRPRCTCQLRQRRRKRVATCSSRNRSPTRWRGSSGSMPAWPQGPRSDGGLHAALSSAVAAISRLAGRTGRWGDRCAAQHLGRIPSRLAPVGGLSLRLCGARRPRRRTCADIESRHRRRALAVRRRRAGVRATHARDGAHAGRARRIGPCWSSTPAECSRTCTWISGSGPRNGCTRLPPPVVARRSTTMPERWLVTPTPRAMPDAARARRRRACRGRARAGELGAQRHLRGRNPVFPRLPGARGNA